MEGGGGDKKGAFLKCCLKMLAFKHSVCISYSCAFFGSRM